MQTKNTTTKRFGFFAVAALMTLVLLLIVAGCSGTDPGGAAAETGAPQASRNPDPADPNAVRIAKDPTDIPGPIGDRGPELVVVELESVELTGELADGTTYEYWTFNSTVPGPMIRAREGDTVEIRLNNADDSMQVHSIDLHAVNGPGGGAAATQVMPGEEKAFRFKALAPGVYVYHCATPYIPAHVANGMYGLIVIEPEGDPSITSST